jgi:hypothetical protein
MICRSTSATSAPSGQAFGDLESLLDGRQQQDPGIRSQPPAIEPDMHHHARHCWQTRQNPRIFPLAGANSVGVG